MAVIKISHRENMDFLTLSCILKQSRFEIDKMVAVLSRSTTSGSSA